MSPEMILTKQLIYEISEANYGEEVGQSTKGLHKKKNED
jgi:hypothetical protein